jgi:hypothetical protein
MKKTKQPNASRLKRQLFLFIAMGALICPGGNFAGTETISRQQEEERGIVSGLVIDAKTGENLIGAVVMFDEHNDIATITDVKGKFLLQVPDMQKGKLSVSALGFIPKTIAIKGLKTFLIPLEEDTTALER